MIEHLRVAKTANFHRLSRRLSNAAVDDLFRQLRASQNSVSNNHFHYRRVAEGNAHWSAISFSYEQEPSFLPGQNMVSEQVCGFLLLVEHRGHLAVFKSRLDLPSGFVTRFLGRVSVDRFDAVVARADAIFEKIRLRHLSISKHAMRNKTLEADDLRSAVGPAGSSRYAPQAYRVRSNGDHFAATPSTGRVAQRSDRVDHLTLVHYARAFIDELIDYVGEPDAFMRLFARAIDLESIEGVTRPVSFAVDVAGLADALYEADDIRLVRDTGAGIQQLAKAETDAILAELAGELEVRGEGKRLELVRPDTDDVVGAIQINKSRIALRDLTLPLLAEVEVERTEFAIGADPERLGLRRYLDREDDFLLLFDQLVYAYLDGVLFRDDGLAGGGAEFLRYLLPHPALDTVMSEKGEFKASSTAFEGTSTFGAVVDSISADDEVLVCDDLGDEWADFIGLDLDSSPPRVTFYHAKHGALSLGASPFHVAIAQAQKNLRNLTLPAEALPTKINGWNKNYVAADKTKTAIAKVIRSTGDLATLFREAGRAPDAIRRAVIVTSSLSRAGVAQAFDEIAAGHRPSAHFVQLYWLLSTFYSSCADMNAFGYVICRP